MRRIYYVTILLSLSVICFFFLNSYFYNETSHNLILQECSRRTAQIFNKEQMDSEIPSLNHIKSNIVGLILARGGSKGIPKKNLAKVGNISLIGRSLDAIYKFGRFSSVWVSTDSADIADEARSKGAQIHWRSKESATDIAPSILGVHDFICKHSDVDIIALIQCTSPFLTATFLSEAYNTMFQKKYDSVFSVTRKHELRWIQKPDGTVHPLNFKPYKRPRKQDWKGELVENGMFYFATVELINQGLLQGGRIGVIEIPANYSIDINTSFDLQVARAQIDLHLFL